MTLTEKVKKLPDASGVYIMLDEFGEILYVGKAKSLAKRVRHYFLKSVNDAKTLALVAKIKDLRYIVTPSEIDALVLENNLIKKHKPPYNILLKDDKTYPYIKITVKEKFPRVEVTRTVKNDGAKYFGPYMVGISSAATMALIHYVFPIRSCRKDISKVRKNDRECLNYHIGRCLAPCVGKCGVDGYRKVISDVMSFLNGDDKSVRERLENLMKEAAERQEFELARDYRDSLKTLDSVVRKQVTALPKDSNIDVFAKVSDSFATVVSVMNIRAGKTVGVDNFVDAEGVADGDCSQFIMQYYGKHPVLATEIMTAEPADFEAELSGFLSEKAGRKVRVFTPKAGVRKQLTDMAVANGKEYLEKNAGNIKKHNEMTLGAVNELYEVLNLSKPPMRMECYDISNISGTNKVSSMVVFQNGEKASDMYRKFKIKTVVGSDDFKSMRETLTRRIAKLTDDSRDVSFKSRPDLIIIDGGKGQLSAVADIIPDDVDVISLAKREEEVFRRTDPTNPVILSMDSQALKLLQRIRDEAHRFAITFHRDLRGKRMLDSRLTEIDGVGEALAKRLMTEFKTLENIATASAEELRTRARLSQTVAENVYNYFRN